jgi:hypothetical protein
MTVRQARAAHQKAQTQNRENNPCKVEFRLARRRYPAFAVTIQIDAGSGTVSPFA